MHIAITSLLHRRVSTHSKQPSWSLTQLGVSAVQSSPIGLSLEVLTPGEANVMNDQTQRSATIRRKRIGVSTLAAVLLFAFSWASPTFAQYSDPFWSSDPWGPDGVCTLKPWKQKCANNPLPSDPLDPVPEPTGALLFAAGSLVIYASTRRRRKA